MRHIKKYQSQWILIIQKNRRWSKISIIYKMPITTMLMYTKIKQWAILLAVKSRYPAVNSFIPNFRNNWHWQNVPNGFLDAAGHEDLRAAAHRGVHAGAEIGARPNTRAHALDPGHQDVITAIFGGVMGASVPINAPITGKGRCYAWCATWKRIAIKEGEVGGDEVGPVGHADRELGGEVVLVGGDEGQEVVAGRGAGYPVGGPGGVGHQRFTESLKIL